MPGHPFYTLGGSDTVEVSVAVAAGQGVEVTPGTGTGGVPGKVRPWSAGSTTRVGIAQIAGVPEGGNAVNNLAPLPRHISVQRAPVGTRMQYAAAAGWRDPLIAAANGQVTPAGGSPDPLTIVGYCDEPAGVSSGATGRVHLV